MKIFDDKTVDLDLNGPILSFTTEPTGVGSTGVGINSTGGGTVSLTGIATATFPTTADNSGIITYRWYEEGVGALSDSTYITGTATTTLTLTNLITPSDNQRKFYLQVDYIPSYYETGNALNEPFNSGVGTVTVDPLIEIIAEPTSQNTLINSTTGTYATGKFVSFTVNANLSDSYFADDLTYQWFIDGEAATDEVRTKTTTTGTTVSGPINNTYNSTTGPIIVPSTATDIEVVVAGAKGGDGGYDGGGPGGEGAQGRAGRFSMPDGAKDLYFYIGNQGNGGGSGNQNVGGGEGLNPGTADGGRGGGAGQQGWSGGGGGGGAGSYLTNNGSRIIVAGGGGGGGGGSHNRAGEPGKDRTQRAHTGKLFGEGSLVRNEDGADGQTKNGDGGGGGGGGGGAWPAGEGGNAGQDNSHGGEAGTGGGSAWNPSILSRVGSEWLNDGNGYGSLKYTGTTSTSITTTRKTSISGSTTKTLKVACDTVGIQTAQCKISSATASNSYLMTDEVTAVFVSTAAANEIKIEAVGNTASASLSDIDLNNGEYTFNVEGTDADNNGLNQFYVLYSPNKDIDVEMDLYGGKGTSTGMNGGEGGYSRIRFTLEQNQEYVIAGLLSSVNAPFVYRRGILMACVGEGAPATLHSHGGTGGGVNVAGESGFGRHGGQPGGAAISAGSLGGNGIFGSTYSAPEVYPGDTQATGNDGGRTIKCTKGIYWRQQGVSACDNIPSSNKFRLSDGTIVTNTTDSISRGFKAGYNIMQTAGKATGLNAGRGGNGATGGTGGGSNSGGGGSGYHDGTVTVVSTQLGGSTGDAKVVLRLQT